MRVRSQFFSPLCICLLFCSAMLWLNSAPNAWAQSTAQINGIVKDQSSAVLPGVEVSMTQTDTGLKRTAFTDETGSYVLTNRAEFESRLGYKTLPEVLHGVVPD